MEKVKVWMLKMGLLLAIQAPFMIHAAADTTANREERRAAFKACETSTGFTRPQRGQHPDQWTEEEHQARQALRAKMEACLLAKGITPPQHGEHHHGSPPPAAANEESSSSNAE